MFNQSEFNSRRQRLLQQVDQETIIIIPTSPEYLRNGDTHFLFRPHSDFYYLTGFAEPEAIAVLIAGRPQGEYILFNRRRDPSQEVWTGRRVGQEGVCHHYGVDQAYPIDEFVTRLPDLMQGCRRVCYPMGLHPQLDQQILQSLNTLRSKVRAGVPTPSEFIDVTQLVHAMRLYKSPVELQAMRKAGEISANAHKRAMQVCKAGMYEYQLEAELIYEFRRHGAFGPAYPFIVGGGENGCILHYTDNNALLKEGDLVLIDAGCEYQYYSSDITRTFPVNGRFTPEQKMVYELVLQIQLHIINMVKPGLPWNSMQDTAVQLITEGLVRLGILKGKVDTLIQTRAYEAFYMHRVGHWLGLDTHDVGNYRMPDGLWRLIEPGMVFTVEPGIYIAANNPDVDPKWWNIGVRIEDNVVVTTKGCEILTGGVPKTVEEVEALVGLTPY